jgi:hypothetical protein
MKNEYIRREHITGEQFKAILKLFCADIEGIKIANLTGVHYQTVYRVVSLLHPMVAQTLKLQGF